MGLGAIVVVGLEGMDLRSVDPFRGKSICAEPLEYCDILGRSLLERTIERFTRAEVDVVSVLIRKDLRSKPNLRSLQNVEVKQVSDDLISALYQQLKEYSLNGIEHTFVVSGNVYAETDLLDLFYFHREARRSVTRATDRDGALNLWVVDCEKAQPADLKNLTHSGKGKSSYFIREYVNRLVGPGDLRQFATDVLRGRCSTRPPGQEVKRGIWLDDGAEIHRKARIVAPAYIGRASKVMEDTLVTRFSNIEKDCCIDYGTVIEDSSILEGTHVGICLDVCHAIANGNKLMSLRRNVVVEISDHSVMRAANSAWRFARDRKRAKNGKLLSRRKAEDKIVAEVPAGSAPEPSRWSILGRSERNA